MLQGSSPLTCKTHVDAREYMGTITTTASGKTCQRWDQQSPHQHDYIADTDYPDDTMSSAENYCRNPIEHDPGIWCYTTDTNTRYEYCEVPPWCEGGYNLIILFNIYSYLYITDLLPYWINVAYIDVGAPRHDEKNRHRD